MRKVLRKVKTILVKGFIGLNFILFMLSACGLDNDHWMAMLAICMVSFANLAMFAIANGAMRGDWDER
jgi:hypothetical protein